MTIVNTRTLVPEKRQDPVGLKELRRVRLLVGAYLGTSVLTLFAIVLLRDHSAIVTAPVWVRGSVVVASASLTTLFTAQMARGSRAGYLRVRLLSAIMLAAIVVIIALPGTFPLWMKVEQGLCGVLLLGVVILVNGQRLRLRFAAR